MVGRVLQLAKYLVKPDLLELSLPVRSTVFSCQRQVVHAHHSCDLELGGRVKDIAVEMNAL